MMQKSPSPGSMPQPPSPDVASMMNQGMAQKLAEQGAGGGRDPQQMMQQLAQMGGQAGGQSGSTPGATSNFQPQKTPRELGTIQEEAHRAMSDLAQGLVDVPVDIVKDIFGLHRSPKTPEEQAKLQQVHQRYQQLNMEQQQAYQMRVQQEMQRKQMMEQEAEMRRQQEAQSKQQGFSMPGGKVTGQAALDKMQQDRKGIGGASG